MADLTDRPTSANPTTPITVTNGEKQFEHIEQNDVVILPAFGATIQEMQLLDKKGVQIVDTTCPWVSKVWTAVEKHRCVARRALPWVGGVALLAGCGFTLPGGWSRAGPTPGKTPNPTPHPTARWTRRR